MLGPFYNRYHEEINLNHTLLLFFTSILQGKKDFRLYWGSSKVMFKKNLTDFCQISRKT